MEACYFITGLPRTRTAWLANLFSYQESFCYHEALKHVSSVNGLVEFLKATDAKYVGDSDSGLPFVMEQVIDHFTNARLVVIERDPNSVIESLRKAFPFASVDFPEMVLRAAHAIEELKKKFRPLVVAHRDLERMEICRRVWDYCLPDVPFNERRWQMLDPLTVEIRPDKYLKSISPESARWSVELVKNYKRNE